MKSRVRERRLARRGRTIRRDLVHAAGCMEFGCVGKLWIRDKEIVNEVRVRVTIDERTVSVPRSLRGLLGRYL